MLQRKALFCPSTWTSWASVTAHAAEEIPSLKEALSKAEGQLSSMQFGLQSRSLASLLFPYCEKAVSFLCEKVKTCVETCTGGTPGAWE